MPIDFDGIKEGLSTAFGDNLRDVMQMRLGHPAKANTVNKIDVSLTETDTPGMVWVFDDTGELGVTMALNSGRFKIADKDKVYGRPVLVKRDNGRLVIAGYGYERETEYMHGVVVQDPTEVSVSRIEWGALRSTNPYSMRVYISQGMYYLQNVPYLIAGTESADLTSYVPATAGKAVAVRIQVSAAGALTYTAGSEFDSTLSHVSAFADYYPQTASETLFTIGWVKLMQGMTAIQPEAHIFAAPEYLSKGASGGGEDALVWLGW